MNEKAISETARIAAMDTTHPSGDPRFADLDRTIESYNREPTSLIQVLHAAQQMFGYLSADVLRYVATALKLPFRTSMALSPFTISSPWSRAANTRSWSAAAPAATCAARRPSSPRWRRNWESRKAKRPRTACSA